MICIRRSAEFFFRRCACGCVHVALLPPPPPPTHRHVHIYEKNSALLVCSDLRSEECGNFFINVHAGACGCTSTPKRATRTHAPARAFRKKIPHSFERKSPHSNTMKARHFTYTCKGIFNFILICNFQTNNQILGINIVEQVLTCLIFGGKLWISH